VLEAKLAPGTKRIEWSSAEQLARHLADNLGLEYVAPSEITIDTEWEPDSAYAVGSLRRMKSDIGDIDMLVTSPVLKAEVAMIPGVIDVTGGKKQINFTYAGGGAQRKVNLFVFLDPETFGAALFHGTGPQMYNVRIRRVAQSKGMKLSQNGLYSIKGGLLPSATERDIQMALGVKNREATER